MTRATMGSSHAGVSPGRQLGFLWGGVALSLIALSPLGKDIAGRMMACPLKSLTGVPCPTCGTGRAALALAQFHFLEAFQAFPLATLAWVVLIGGGLLAGGLALLGYGLPALPRRIPLLWRLLFVAGVLVNWIYLIWTGV